ncbi:hypothetical protein [Hymenobacter sp. BT559]|jgi:hypothetical protein|uniref:hypothetical protein n=1 Tax=Hymenobacter sp. BT559 TaxID=2795729 RepID=UPI0018EB7B4B|nr:hypothetical protein [Hymenobacter sp. BT559]MBJ6145017.1 hypothetical protein [Hymenobacter sp. BT559]
MPTTRSEQDQATQPTQSDQYQPDGRQEPTNPDALYGGNADDNSGSGGNAGPTNLDAVPANKADGTIESADQNEGAIKGGGVSGGTASSGSSIGQVNLG